MGKGPLTEGTAFLRPSKRLSPWRSSTAAAALVLYGLIWTAWVHRWAPLTKVDWDALDFFHTIGVSHPGWVRFWNVFCTIFDPTVLRVALVVPIAFAWRRGARATAWFLAVTTWGSAVIVFVGKLMADRPRPDTALVHAAGTSFPSGHAAGDLVIVWAVLAVTLPLMSHRLRAVAVTFGVLLVATVGMARVILNVHHPSDVAAGWLLGYAYFQVCWMLWAPEGAWTLSLRSKGRGSVGSEEDSYGAVSRGPTLPGSDTLK